ncbi:YybS family protein [Gracilibacillus alcaliphilus]|uniref:YybS family protein n=1 Tax=Gracilibacillus alcaliphilus TaxID=1401441 RepID=UPI0019586615|nr:DUF2232 domain-containing protein [Gracilibacillus alcaliphilus]MBM7678704.1 uncharacterized protein YybS (DUF2232 family) [Gracilibacillus alcaliphilus]
MEQQTIKKDFFICIGIFIAMLLATIFLPLQVVMLFLLPIPIILIVKNYPIKYISIAMAVMLLLASVIVPALSIPVTVFALLSGGMIGWPLKKDRHPYEIWANGAAGFVLGFAFIYLFVEAVLNISIIDSFMASMDESLAMTERIFGAVGADTESLELVKEQVNALIQLLPVILAVVSMVYAFVTQWLTFKWLNRGNRIDNLYVFPAFRQLKFPKAMLWIYFILLVFTFFIGPEMTSIGQVAVWNLFHMTGFLVALQGLSFIYFYAHAKKKSLALPVVAIIVTILFPVMGLYLLRILGIIDLGFELRKRMTE